MSIARSTREGHLMSSEQAAYLILRTANGGSSPVYATS